MEVKLSQLLKDTQTLIGTEAILNEFYYGKQKTPLRLRLRTCNKHSPKIKQIAHDGQLKILAFSDYRTQKIEELLHLLRYFKEKPDLIIYAGDDVDRFAPLREELFRFSYNDNQEVERVWVSDDGRSWSSPLYGLILRLPKIGTNEDTARSRIFEVMSFIDAFYDKWCENKTLREKDLEELLTEYPTFQSRRGRSEFGRTKVDVIDSNMGTTIISLCQVAPLGYIPDFLSGYFILYRLVKNREPSSITAKKIREDRDYAYFHISISEPKRNIFEELASYAKYGLVAIIGNDNVGADRFRIYGRNVYEIHNTWVDIGQLFIVGLEGSTCGLGPSGDYSEGSVRLRLELAREVSKGKKLLIVSHSPPKGVLDRAMRFGEEAIGSLALRDFLEENNNVTLVVCGHVHRCGGRYEKINNTTIVNVSSHDDPFSRANMAWIILDQNGEVKEIKWLKLPSLLEAILREYNGEERLLRLQKEVGLSKNETILFMEAYNKYGNKLLEELPELANIKHRYGFSWSNIFKLYDYGVKAPELITKAVYENALKQSFGIDKVHLKRAYAKVLREQEKENIYLINPISIPDNNQIVIFDTEYSETTGVLYGFLDIESGELKQFWFDEKPKAQEYLRTRLNKVFVHWGGLDRSLLQQELNCQASTLNLLYFVQTSLVAPISSTNLREVHDVLYGALEDEFWKSSFYEKNGLDKLVLCNRILREPSDAEAREELAAANKADILALQHIIEKIRQLKSGIHLHPCKMDKHEPIKEMIHPIINQKMFNSIVHRLYESMVKHIKSKQKYKIRKVITDGLPGRERGFLTLFKVLRKASI
ncbi:MAG: metallophosphoesterase [Candidatus Bathyarchaeia archaeon]